MPQGQLKEKVVLSPHPGGIKGAMMSLDEVAKKMWASRNDPRVRAWTTQELAKAGNPTGARDKMQVVVDAYRKKVPYVSDPVQTEFMASPVQTLCLDDHGLCIVGGDCDDAAITVGACLLSIGIPVQVVGASYKEPTEQPTHVYIQAQDDAGQWLPIDPTTKYEVGSVHDPARTWIVEPNKGVGAAGLEGGDFVGVGRSPSAMGLGQAYEALLQQTITQAEALERMWQEATEAVTDDPYSDPCSGVGGPSALVPWLQEVSDQACSVAHNAALAAVGYTVNCSARGASLAANTQDAADVACTLGYTWAGPNWGPYGTVTMSGNYSGTCLDVNYFNAVGEQVKAALYAVGQAEATAAACAVPVTRTRRALPAGRRVGAVAGPPRSEWGGLARGGASIGLGLVTPGDVLSYRTTWNQYVIDTVGSADACADAYSALAAQQSDASTKALLTGLGDAIKKQADALLAMWNLYANKDDAFIVLQGASILQSYQETVVSAGQVRQNITTGTLTCSLSYVNSQGQLVQAIPAADPSVQAQVIARIEGLGILSSGVLQVLVTTTGNSLVAAGSAARWTAEQVNRVTGALATPWPWIAVTAVAGGVIVYEFLR
ncbi:MAG TPA: transglutaminase domain-containing protein [Polyangiaceae bacterium]|nr:transglutaminase domain-containing protein [Polyangiaceae bacterium]